jgi:membrane-bound metal-dependent hydrolase YbcI (DUF457 family)
MDPVTHAITARMAASVNSGPMSRGTAVLAVIGGLAPDADAVFMPFGWDIYLRVHEAGTHSIAGAIVLAGALAIICRVFVARPFRALFIVALIAISSHLLLDVVSGAAVRLGWPLVEGRTALGLVAMADPWLAIPFAAALLVVLVSRFRIETVAPYVFVFAGILLAGKLVSRQVALAQYRTVADALKTTSYVQAQWGCRRSGGRCRGGGSTKKQRRGCEPGQSMRRPALPLE